MERIQKLGGWRSTKVANGYVENSIKYKEATRDLIRSATTSSSIASQGYIDHAMDDLEIDFTDFTTVSSTTASQGYMDHVNDDSEMPYEEVSDFTGDEVNDTLQGSDIL